MIRARTGLVVVLLALGCDAAKKNCEHARDVVVAEADRAAKAAIATVAPQQRAELERVSARETEHMRNVFVEKCVAQPEATQACIARIDELLAAEQTRKEASERCAGDDACYEAAKAAAEKAAGECGAAMGALMKAVNGAP